MLHCVQFINNEQYLTQWIPQLTRARNSRILCAIHSQYIQNIVNYIFPNIFTHETINDIHTLDSFTVHIKTIIKFPHSTAVKLCKITATIGSVFISSLRSSEFYTNLCILQKLINVLNLAIIKILKFTEINNKNKYKPINTTS